MVDNLIRGGQGRQPQQVKEDSYWFGVCMVLTVVLILVSAIAKSVS